jgi:hypothetical protein
MGAGGPISLDVAPHPVFDHLYRLTDEHGLHEHALFADPRPEHGYCVDDVARGLVVTCRQPQPGAVVRRLQAGYLDFVLSAIGPDGSCHNRMSPDGTWADDPGLGDWWGRAVWALGVAAAHALTPGQRARARSGFRILVQQRSVFSRSMAFAALGAGELVQAGTEPAADRLLADAIGMIDPSPAIGASDSTAGWPWPEARLRYANAAVPEALLVAGAALAKPKVVNRGLELLTFLMSTETIDDHLSVTPVGGRGSDATRPGFDQQPIEVAAIADACATALRVTTDTRWRLGIDLAWAWFCGDNDSGALMFDPDTGGGFDGLQADGPNRNQGAESTLALLATAQHAQRIHELR